MNKPKGVIVVIDDELAVPAQADAFSHAYPLDDFAYQFYPSFETAKLRLLSNHGPALILLDIRFENVGDEHGLDILAHLRADYPHIPVVMMSSRREPAILIRSWELGAKSYIVKWGDNPGFYADLKTQVQKHAQLAQTTESFRAHREVLRSRTRRLQEGQEHRSRALLDQAKRFVDDLGVPWSHSIPFPKDFQNYINGWNATDEEYREAAAQGSLLFINIDFGTGCTLNCPHCFTRDGAIDDRGRDIVSYDILKNAINEAKELGLKCVRILGQGEPTQWIHGRAAEPKQGEDFLDFVEFLRSIDVIPLVFTRGQVLGDDEMVKALYRGRTGIRTGRELADRLKSCDASVFLGLSSIFPEINDEMVGRGEARNYDSICRNALRLLIQGGFNQGNPTRLAVESPITNLNILEMPIRYVLFQMLNISPCANVYMIAGRAVTYGLGEITDPGQQDFLDTYAMIAHFMRRMGIPGKLGPYAGTKECHDVSHGVYLTLNGDLYPCPGYENIQNYIGSIQTSHMRDIWMNNPYGRHPQSICPPKIGTHFPPEFEETVERELEANVDRYEATFVRICRALQVTGA